VVSWSNPCPVRCYSGVDRTSTPQARRMPFAPGSDAPWQPQLFALGQITGALKFPSATTMPALSGNDSVQAHTEIYTKSDFWLCNIAPPATAS